MTDRRIKRARRDRREGNADPAVLLQAIRHENSTLTAMKRDARLAVSPRNATAKKGARTRKTDS